MNTETTQVVSRSVGRWIERHPAGTIISLCVAMLVGGWTAGLGSAVLVSEIRELPEKVERIETEHAEMRRDIRELTEQTKRLVCQLQAERGLVEPECAPILPPAGTTSTRNGDGL